MAGRARAQYTIAADDRASRSVKRVQRSFRDLGSSVAILQGPLGSISGRLSAIGAGLGRISPVTLSAGVSIAAFSAAVVKAVNAGSQLEKQQGRLESLIRATGGAAGVSGQEIDRMTRDLGIATLTSATTARDAAGILLSFRTITGDTFERTLRVSQDLAEVMGSDLKSATLQVAKALEDPAVGLTMLRRSGVSFTQTQREMITAMVDGGRQAEAQKVILDRLEEQVGGAGSGAATGLTGAVDTLGESWTHFLEELSRSTGAGEIAKNSIEAIRGAVDDARESMEGSRRADPESLEARRLSMVQTIATLEAQILESKNSGPLAAKMIAAELEVARKNFAALRSEIEVADEFDGLAASMEEVNKQAKDLASVQAKTDAEEEARIALVGKFEKKLHDVRKALGSSVIKNQEAAAQVDLLRFAYDQGNISLAEFLELQKKINDADKKKKKIQEGGVIDFLPGFVAPKAAPALSRKSDAVRTEANDEEKQQTVLLNRIERHLANGQTRAVTI